MYWLAKMEDVSLLMAYLPQDEIWEGGMPGEWLEKLSLETFSQSVGEGSVPLSFPAVSTVAGLKDAVERTGADVLVLSLTKRAYFSEGWWRPLVEALRGEGAALALPMGPSLPPSQGLPVAYWTPSDLEVLSERFGNERRVVDGEFNPLMGALAVDALLLLNEGLALRDLFQEVARKKKVVAAGGLVHFFADFYGSTREDMLRFISRVPQRVLDVGCAKGEFGRVLKERFGCEVWGIEIVEESAAQAAKVLDKVNVMDVEEASPDWKGLFDLVVLGDILEHLRDPWGFLKKVRGWMTSSGEVIVSVPNTGFYPVVRALLQGRFDYVPVGLLCVEHLRFFTKNTLREMFEESGFEVLKQEPQPAGLPEEYEREIEELTRVIPNLDKSCLSSPGYYIVATPKG